MIFKEIKPPDFAKNLVLLGLLILVNLTTSVFTCLVNLGSTKIESDIHCKILINKEEAFNLGCLQQFSLIFC